MSMLKRVVGRRLSALVLELVLIFLGITAALWFESAGAERDERALEVVILHEMKLTLESDTVDLHQNLIAAGTTLTSIDTVLAYLVEGRPYRPALDAYFGRVASVTGFFHNPAAYEYLRSSGLGVISNDALRQHIVRYYDYEVPGLLVIEEYYVHDGSQDFMQPQVMAKFDYDVSSEVAVPRNYASLRTDHEFLNALRAASGGLKFQIARTENTLNSATSLIAEIALALSP